ncbi:fungal-specific transcription factor domain-containing protein [Mycena maculata]|uniref:Fungal-specific transcription factor domain-containing protein n=1 Tax=Mycena maculata TaxID=230809 RepID=A0AAD7JVF8_9AGAR|nr:fungal-specific transcription factor domain-containing protein [Mycena maculata]
MTLDRDGTSEPPRPRRIQGGACDFCKKRKIRCDSAEKPGNRCTHCINYGLDCTRQELVKTSNSPGYVAALESRVEKMERLLNKLLPGIDVTEQLENENEVESLLPHAETLPRNDMDVSDAMRKLKLNPDEHRFFGRSSGIQFVQTALNFQSRCAGLSRIPRPILPNKRVEFWNPPTWLLPINDDAPRYTFPEPDLLSTLVNLYFKEVNCFSPLLHRPTFDRKVTDNLHLVDHRFAATLLMVCSLGARYSDDPRTLLEGQSAYTSAGWKWHSQVRVIPGELTYKPDLYELQTIALSTMYLRVFSPMAVCWTQVGFALRRAQDVGAHRRRIETHPTVENEHWKRVFWVLICLDWVYGTHTGRPVLMHKHDYDQDLPIECDDEYWDLPEPHRFKQPKDKPSALAYFNRRIKLLEIQAAVTTTLYSPRKPNHFSSRPPPYPDAQTIMALDSALNAWLSEVPDHLRWDPLRRHKLHFNQSALLYAEYYSVQILLHRPFIPAPLENPPPGALPSLAICTSAARSCARIFDAQDRRGIPLNDTLLMAYGVYRGDRLLNKYLERQAAGVHSTQRTRSCSSMPPSDDGRGAQASARPLDSSLNTADVVENYRYLGPGRYRGGYYRAGRYSDILNRFVYGGGNVEALFSRETRDAPLGKQRTPGFTFNGELAAEWASTFTRHFQEDLEPSSRGLLDAVEAPRDADVPHGFDVDAIFDFEQLMNVDLPSFSAEMSVDTPMWSTVPGFYVDDWSQYLAGPQFDQLVPEENPAEDSTRQEQQRERDPFTWL